jgi:hypothetical protein
VQDQESYEVTDEAPRGTGSRDSGPVLPGGISVKTAAWALLIVAVAATLFLVLVPRSDQPSGLPTATATAAPVLGTRPITPLAATVAPGAAGSAVATSASAAVGATPGLPVPAPGAGLATAAPLAAAGSLSVGGFAKVTGTGPDGMRYRYGPGLDYVTIRIVPEGEVLKVTGGPETADGFTWWRLQDSLANVGWAAVQFVAPSAAPAAWNPPAASPTFATGARSGNPVGTP